VTDKSDYMYRKSVFEPQLRLHRRIKHILTPGRLDSYAGVKGLKFPDGIKKNGEIFIAYSVEGVGTKILVAQLAKKFDTVGIDLVAMNVNDIICSGSKPFAFADYLAIGRDFPREYFDALCEGVREGASRAAVQIVSGETAIVPDMVQGVEPSIAFDMAGSSIGYLADEPITGAKIANDDAVVALCSSGLHSNGYSLARPCLLRYFRQNNIPCANLEIDDVLPDTSKTIGEELLTPTKIYVKEVNEAVDNLEVHGLAHITGQGFKKLLRLCYFTECGLLIDELPDVPLVMRLIQKTVGLSERDMYNTFNMGAGFVIVLPKDQTDLLLSICEKNGTSAKVMGQASSDLKNRVKIKTQVGAFEFQGKLE
jgi:phosphoribosylformylglycinamidine cyclo-ligase